MINRSLNILKEVPSPIKKLNWVIFIYYLGYGIVYPFLGIFLKERLDNYTTAAVAIALFHSFAFPWSLFLGERIDQIPKKKIINFALVLHLLNSFIFLSLKNFTQFLMFQIFHAGMSVLLWGTSEACVRKYSPKDKPSLCISSFNSFRYLSLVLGGIISGFLFKHFSFNIIYAISFFAFWALLFAIFLPNNEKITKQEKDTIGEEIKNFWKNKKLVRTTLVFITIMMVVAILDFALPIIAKSFSANPIHIGLAYGLFYIPLFSQVFFAFPKNKERLLKSSLILAFLTFIAMFLIPNIPMLLAGSLVIGLAIASIIPIISGQITLYINKNKIGEQSAVVYAFKKLAMSWGYMGAGIIADLTQLQNIFIFGALIILLILFEVIKFKEA